MSSYLAYYNFTPKSFFESRVYCIKKGNSLMSSLFYYTLSKSMTIELDVGNA